MGCLHARITLCRLGEPGWKQSCVDDSAAVVLNLVFTVLGVEGVGRNHSRTLCIITGLSRDLLLPQCSVGQFLAPLLLTAAAADVLHSPKPNTQPEPGLCKLMVGGDNLSSV